MNFLYKDNDGTLVFQNFRVIVHDEDPDIEKFLAGEYKNYDIIYHTDKIQFKATVRSSLFSKKYKIEDIVYSDGVYYFTIYTPIEGKSAKIFIENFEKILKNPKNIYLVPYLDEIGTEFNVEYVPYRAYYSDEQYLLSHGFFETLYILKKKTYLETYSVDIEISMGKRDVVSIFNGIFSCKDHKCIINKFGKKARIISTKRILARDLYDIVMNDNVYALVHDDDTYYFLLRTPDGRIMRFYTNPDTELVFRIEPDDNSNDAVNVEIKYYDLIDTLNRGNDR